MYPPGGEYIYPFLPGAGLDKCTPSKGVHLSRIFICWKTFFFEDFGIDSCPGPACVPPYPGCSFFVFWVALSSARGRLGSRGVHFCIFCLMTIVIDWISPLSWRFESHHKFWFVIMASTTTTGANAVSQLQLASSWTPKNKPPGRPPLMSLLSLKELMAFS